MGNLTVVKVRNAKHSRRTRFHERLSDGGTLFRSSRRVARSAGFRWCRSRARAGATRSGWADTR